jgi:hypothetical protein
MTAPHPDRDTDRWLDVLSGRTPPANLEEELAAQARRAHLAEREAFLQVPSDAARDVRLHNMLEARHGQARAQARGQAAGTSAQGTHAAGAGVRQGQSAAGAGAGSGAMGWGRLAVAVGVGVAAALLFGLRTGGPSPTPDPIWQAKGGKAPSPASAPGSSEATYVPQVVATPQPEADARALKRQLEAAGFIATLRQEADGAWWLEAPTSSPTPGSVDALLAARGLTWPTQGPLQVRFVAI